MPGVEVPGTGLPGVVDVPGVAAPGVAGVVLVPPVVDGPAVGVGADVPDCVGVHRTVATEIAASSTPCVIRRVVL